MRGTTPSTPSTRSPLWKTSGRFLNSLTTHCNGSITVTSTPRWRQASIRREVEYSVALRDRMAIFIPRAAPFLQPCALRATAPVGFLWVPLAEQVLGGHVDSKVPFDGLAPENHTEEQPRAVGEAEQDLLAQGAEHHLRLD